MGTGRAGDVADSSLRTSAQGPTQGLIDQRIRKLCGGALALQRAMRMKAADRATPLRSQPRAKKIASAKEPPLDGSHRPAQKRGDFFVGPALEVAEDDRQTVLVG